MAHEIFCRSPRGGKGRFILRVVISSLGSISYPFCVHAIEPPSVVIEDTVTLGVGVKTVELDTTHFGEPSLLVGTLKNGGGDAFVLRVRTNPLEVAETLYTCQSVPLLVRAGRLDADEFPDLLVSLRAFCPDDSPSYSSVVLLGPAYEVADTLCFGSYLRDAIIDDSSHEVWLAFIHDSVRSGETFLVTFTLGTVLRRDDIYLETGEDTLLRLKGGAEMSSVDVNLDGVRERVVFWKRLDMSWCWEVHCPDRWWNYFGVLIADNGCDSLLLQTWLTKGTAYDIPYPGVKLEVNAPIGVGDLNTDRYPDAVVGWFTTLHSYDWYNGDAEYGVVTYSLQTGATLWQRQLPSSWSDRAPAATLWDLDSDGMHDVLASQKVLIDNTASPLVFENGVWGFGGSSGDSLFYFESPFVLDPVVVGALDNSGIRKGVLARADTLFVFYLDFSPTGVDDDELLTPAAFELFPNYPNPFNAQTRIAYEINRPADVTLKVYDILGRYVTTLINATQTTGQQSVTWDGRDFRGIAVSSGVYFYRMKSGDTDQVRKMLLLK